jgi:hypothetical protein
MRLRRGETVRTQTPNLLFWEGDHLRRPYVALGLPPPYTHAEAGRFAAGAQIITETSTEFG